MMSFVQFYEYIANPANRRYVVCPACRSPVIVNIFPSFNMVQTGGAAKVTCTNTNCEFSRNPIVIEGRRAL